MKGYLFFQWESNENEKMWKYIDYFESSPEPLSQINQTWHKASFCKDIQVCLNKGQFLFQMGEDD